MSIKEKIEKYLNEAENPSATTVRNIFLKKFSFLEPAKKLAGQSNPYGSRQTLEAYPKTPNKDKEKVKEMKQKIRDEIKATKGKFGDVKIELTEIYDTGWTNSPRWIFGVQFTGNKNSKSTGSLYN